MVFVSLIWAGTNATDCEFEVPESLKLYAEGKCQQIASVVLPPQDYVALSYARPTTNGMLLANAKHIAIYYRYTLVGDTFACMFQQIGEEYLQLVEFGKIDDQSETETITYVNKLY